MLCPDGAFYFDNTEDVKLFFLK